MPGAALHRPQGPEIEVDQAVVAPIRGSVLWVLHHSLLKEDDYRTRLERSVEVLPALLSAVHDARSRVLGSDLCSAAELDAEVGRKSLVTIMGGGAGYVYIGAAARLRAGGLSSDYLVGASIGAVLAHKRQQDIEAVFK